MIGRITYTTTSVTTKTVAKRTLSVFPRVSVPTQHRSFSRGLSTSIRHGTPATMTMSKTNQHRHVIHESMRSYSTALPEGVSVITLPVLSPTMETGTIAEWMVKEGDQVAPGSVVCVVATDKANVDFEFQEDGYIAKILQPTGAADLPLGTPIALLAEDEAALKRAESFEYKPESATPAATSAPAAAKEEKSEGEATPTTTTTTAAAPSAPEGDRIFASPLAKKIATEKGVDLSGLKGQGSGPNNRIIKDDVVNFASQPRATPTPTPPSASVSAPITGEYVDTPITNVRKVIANRLQESKRNIPHYYLTVECQVDSLMEVRAKLNKRAEKSGEYKLSVNDFIIKAASLAMRKVPEVNSSWQDTFIRQYNNVDVSVAVQTDTGLITPIVFDAEKKGLTQISNDVKSLAAKAREGKLQPQEFQGGTFTVSNLGMFGISEFSAIINPPQACILAVGTTEQKVVPVTGADTEKGELPYKVVNVMKVTLSCDHRVVDGAVGARWMQEFKKNMEDPINMLL